MKITFLGGAAEIGASCILINIDNKNILLDSGIRQGSSKDPLPDFRTIQEQGGLDAIIISHAHMDHTGALPMVSKEYPGARIYMNYMTKDLIRVLLYDSLKIMNNREGEIPLYAESDVENMLDRIFTLNYQNEFEILDGIKISFYSAGHVAGASCIYITASEGSIFYSGDFSIFPQNSIEGAKVPKLRPDAAIFEATYGDKLHSNRELEEERLIRIVEKCADTGGKMLIPAFALGRAQEVILILKKAVNKGRLSRIKIYVDGMVKDINRVYKRNPLYLKSGLGKKILKGIEPFYDENIIPVETKELREQLLDSTESSVIISSSGMLTGGPSQSYAEKIAPMENGFIVITGYQDEESPGRKLLKLLEIDKKERIIDLNEKSVPVRCAVERVGLSAHGDKGEIKAMIAQLNPRNIFLVHGEKGIIENFAGELSKEIHNRIYVPMTGESVDLDVSNPRKQLRREFPYILHKFEQVSETNISELWGFLLLHYGERLFTVEELLAIWYGSNKFSISEGEELQKLLLNTPYFENDLRRFFMFRTRKKEAVEQELQPKELKPNELAQLAGNFFSDYNYKKAGIMLEEKKLVLNFDFPRAVSEAIFDKINEFEEKTGWKVEVSDSTNHNSAEVLIRSLLKDIDIKRISYFLNEVRYVVTISSEDRDLREEKEKFKAVTGFELVIKGPSFAGDSSPGNTYKTAAKESMEQNQALQFIERAFEGEESKPYKKGIKSDKIIELSFISPSVGKRYEDKIKSLAEETGWSLKISGSVNQNEIIGLAARLCMEKRILLKKNPSFNPSSNKVTLKPEGDAGINEILFSIKEEFEHKTGCVLEW